MILDVWHELEVRVYGKDRSTSNNKTATITASGYTFAGLWKSMPFGNGFMVILTDPDYAGSVWSGVNFWADLVMKIRNEFSISFASGLFFQKWRGRWTVTVMAGDADNQDGEGALYFGNVTIRNYTTVAGGASESTYNEFSADHTGVLPAYLPRRVSTLYDRPIGVWQPCSLLNTLEPVSVRENIRSAKSPYNPRFNTVMRWGSEHVTRGIWDLVPAADIFSYRVLNIPSGDWASIAGRDRGRAQGSVLEYLWPWMCTATGQFRNYSYGDNGPIALGSAGKPIIAILDDSVLGQSLLFRGNQGGTERDRRDDKYRHLLIDGVTDMQKTLTVREGTNRRYRVQMPFVDVTQTSDRYDENQLWWQQ